MNNLSRPKILRLFSKLFKRRPKQMSYDDICDFLDNLENEGVFLYQKFLWSFQFDDKDPERLESLKEPLAEIGFDQWELMPTSDGFTLDAGVCLELNEEELYDLYLKCYELGKEHKLLHYGDFNVGNTDSSQPIPKDNYFPGISYTAREKSVGDKGEIQIMNAAYMNYAHKSRFPVLVRITLTYQSPEESGMPDPNLMSFFDKYEIVLKKALFACGGYQWIYRTTGFDKRVNVFQVPNADQLDTVLSNLKGKFEPPLPIDYVIRKDPNWTDVERFISEGS